MTPSKICPQCGDAFGPEERFCPKDGTPLRPRGATDPLIGQVLAARYQILELLGEGGMGRVYLAEHVRMGRKSAVKVMSPNLALAADAISRFNREAANASRINHPNVAQIYDFGETDDGLLYLAMEFIEGETLSAVIAREGAMATARAAGLIKQVADALAAAHHLGIVHRDLKPDNIMITRHHDETDWVKVVDFGIAKTIHGSGERGGSQTVTTAGVSIGTPEYMSPEQLAGERLDNRTDLYSLALVLFNMLTGVLPYPRVTSRDTLVRRLTTRPMTLSEVAPSRPWPMSLQAVLDRALAPEPADRYATVADFGRDVVAAAADLGGLGRSAALEAGQVPDGDVRPPSVAFTAATTGAAMAAAGPSSAPMVKQPAVSMPSRGRGRALVAATGVVVLGAVGAGAFFAVRGGSRQTAARDSVAPPPVVAPRDTTERKTENKPENPNEKSDAAVAPVALAAPRRAPVDSSRVSTKRAAAPLVSSPAPAPTVTPPSRGTAAPSPTVQPETTAAQSGKKAAPFRHAWLGANGDTARGSAAVATTDEERVRLISDDIQGHLARANDFIGKAEVPKTRAELREAVPVVEMLRQLYSNTPGEARAEQMLRQGNTTALAACRKAFADPTLTAKFPLGFRCDALIPLGMRALGRGRGRGDAFRVR